VRGAAGRGGSVARAAAACARCSLTLCLTSLPLFYLCPSTPRAQEGAARLATKVRSHVGSTR
jgi:hypothetical protein